MNTDWRFFRGWDFSLEQRRRPTLSEPSSPTELLSALREEASARPSEMVLRIEKKEPMTAIAGVELPELPAGVAAVLQANGETSTRMVADVVRVKHETPWPLEGTKSLTIRVVKQAGLRFLKREAKERRDEEAIRLGGSPSRIDPRDGGGGRGANVDPRYRNGL